MIDYRILAAERGRHLHPVYTLSRNRRGNAAIPFPDTRQLATRPAVIVITRQNVRQGGPSFAQKAPEGGRGPRPAARERKVTRAAPPTQPRNPRHNGAHPPNLTSVFVWQRQRRRRHRPGQPPEHHHHQRAEGRHGAVHAVPEAGQDSRGGAQEVLSVLEHAAGPQNGCARWSRWGSRG